MEEFDANELSETGRRGRFALFEVQSICWGTKCGRGQSGREQSFHNCCSVEAIWWLRLQPLCDQLAEAFGPTLSVFFESIVQVIPLHPFLHAVPTVRLCLVYVSSVRELFHVASPPRRDLGTGSRRLSLFQPPQVKTARVRGVQEYSGTLVLELNLFRKQFVKKLNHFFSLEIM